MSAEDPIVQRSSDRYSLRHGKVVELVFPHGNTAHLENLTLDQAHKLQAKLQVYLWEIRAEAMEREPEELDLG